MNIEKIRSEFEYLKTGKIYFNHASIGPLPSKTVKAVEEYLTQRSAGEINIFKDYLSVEKKAKEKLSELIGCSVNRIAWSDNVGNSMSLLAQGLQWKTGDRIIFNNIEFPSNVYPFMNLRSEGVEIDFVDASDGIVRVEEYEKLITPKTKLISISLVQFLSGYRTDVKALSDICHRNGIVLAVDTIQACGTMKIEAENWGIDFLSGGTQKWLLGLEGLSYLYISEELQNRIKQRNVGWGSVENAWELLDYELKFPSSARRFQGGTPNSVGIFAANSSFTLFVENGIENIEKRIKENSRYLINKLAEIGFSPILLNVDDSHLAGIVTFDAQNAEAIKNELLKKNMIVEVRVGKIRISPHFYNTKEEIDAVVDAIGELKNV